MPKTKGFKLLENALEDEYLGKTVPSMYQKKYGKTYDKKDIVSFAYAVAKSKGIKIE